jgi:hypothetical protein
MNLQSEQAQKMKCDHPRLTRKNFDPPPKKKKKKKKKRKKRKEKEKKNRNSTEKMEVTGSAGVWTKVAVRGELAIEQGYGISHGGFCI